MSKNDTQRFINLVNDVLDNEKSHFNELENIKTIGFPSIEKKILNDYKIYQSNNDVKPQDLFIEHIKQFILSNKDNFTMDTNTLYNISKQIHIDHLMNNKKLEKAHIYYSLAKTIRDYGIYNEDKIIDFSNKLFWKILIKKLYLLNLLSPNGFLANLKGDYKTEIPHLANAIIFFKKNANINLNCIDGEINFQKGQDKKIASIIEKKLQQVDIFNFIHFILSQNRNNKAIPFNYIINIAIKNLHHSNFKKKDVKTLKSITNYFTNFTNLFQLRSFNQFEYMYIDETNIQEKLKKQILHSSLYLLSYPLKTSTVINYIDNLIGDSVLNTTFEKQFSFSKNNLIDFLQQIELFGNKQHIVKLDIAVFKHFEQIVKFFCVDSKNINSSYSIPINTTKDQNLFIHNPIICYKNEYYIIGFKYFKMYFYHALVEKIKFQFDKNITTKIGTNIDNYVEAIFKKNHFDIYSGKYKLSKKEVYECDLVIKLDNKIVFIENKNKALTKNAFAGSDLHILQDFIRAFATSQQQLLRHEKHLTEKKQLSFLNGKVLNYNNEKIIKISLSPNNWYSIMNNNRLQGLLLALMRIRFTFKKEAPPDVIKSFAETNEDLDKLTKIIEELNQSNNLDNILFSSLFIPLELLSENENDKNLIHYILGLLFMKYDTNNIYDSYNEYKKLKEHAKKTKT